MTAPTADITLTTHASPFGELADVLSSLVAADGIPALNRVLDQRVPKLLSCDRSQLVLIDTAGQKLTAYSNTEGDTISLEDPDSPLSRCIRIRQSVAVSETAPSQSRQQTTLAAPLMTAAGTLGAIAAIADREHAFSDIDREIFRSIAATTAAVLLAFLDRDTHLAAAQDQSRQLHEELNAALQAIPHPVIIYDKDFNFRAWNSAFVEIQGYTEDLMLEMGGMANLLRYEVEELDSFPGQTYEEVWQQYLNYYEFEDFNHSVQYWPMRQKHIDRRTRKTESGGWVSVLVDITDWMEDQEKIRLAKDDAEAAARAKSAFLANMSHEIRTPLNAIIGFTQLVLRGDLTQKQNEHLTQVESSSQLLLRILDDILDFSRIDAGMLELESLLFHRDDILGNVVALTGNSILSSDVDLLLTVGEDVPERLIGDPFRLAQILLNLTSNAAKFTHKGSVVLSVDLVERDAEGVTLRFEIADTGIGMAPEQFENLFQAFSQADTSTTRRYGGSGLGLAISKALTTLMGGAIGVESVQDKGSNFHLTVKFKTPTDAAPLPENDIRSDLHVLVVDAVDKARETLARSVEQLGATAGTAAGCETAEHALRTAEPPYDIVLLDHAITTPETANRLRTALQNRPGMSGQQVKRRLIATFGGNEIHESAPAAEMDGMIPKGVTPTRLRDALLTACGEAAPTDRPRPQIDHSHRAALSGLRVLLAEDNIANQRVAREMLEQIGMQVTVAETGQRAIERVRSEPPGTFSAILMDLQMPEMDGLSAARKILGDPGHSGLPIIAMTANAFDNDRQSTRDAGMVDHISKPVDPNKLYAVLAKHAGKDKPS
ncbi:hybrid sensor histidine kinase/response regulator [Nisaea nitritireducens]|uniref:hybrid sensor histidine kinase/response regulator n=1 Tax=Nisaea nitritireducens TaxID=568392 RepID=UPI001867352B|nr:response regulator [Nisaea nitritireducens]